VQADKRWLAAMAERGITDIERVQIDPWPAGNFDLPGEEGRRLARCVCYLRDDPADNGYAHPVEGLVAVVDLATDEVIDVVDSGVVPVPTGSGRYGEGPYRDGLKPIEITQPEGPSFTLEDNEVSWLGWRLGFSVHPIEGLVLHGISYQGRPILARASIAEMVVPYGASGVCHWWKNAFDVGEWGLGRMIQSLALGCDCLGEIRYADAVLPDEMGGARVVANAVCMHEEDYGILWKHVDLWTGNDQVRRSRRFVISSVSTVGNYEYGFYWYFYLDGTIQLEVKLTGIMQTAAGPPEPGRGTRLAEGLWAPNHQHLFCARLDVCVDGPSNSVSEVEAGGAPRGPGNEAGNAIVTRSTPLDTEAGAQRMADPMASRRWRIENRAAGTAYDLVPMSPVTLLADATSSVARRAQFATRNLWVTPYAPDERRPAGDHPNQHPGGDGLPAWTAADRPIVDRELVVWHTFGVNHLPRPEDWPVMPVEYAGFMLRPFGFFERNPALDLPPSHSEHCAG
ncbi:MAG TPA: primary-amine oxidase, partial [Acidimicrobiales bacterium]